MPIVHNNFHIITGGPGAGKTAIIEALAARGFRTVAETGRAIIRRQLAIGGNALHSGDRVTFLALMLDHAIADYDAAAAGGDDAVFFDRGIAELAGYGRITGIDIPEHVRTAARLYRSARNVFVAPPWPEIYVNDGERKQDMAEAIASHDACVAAYCEAGYQPVEIPRAPVAERVAFVLGHLGA